MSEGLYDEDLYNISISQIQVSLIKHLLTEEHISMLRSSQMLWQTDRHTEIYRRANGPKTVFSHIKSQKGQDIKHTGYLNT